MQKKDIVIFTDGSSRGNPGPGGWAFIVAQPHGHITENGGSEADTTNNRMEMTAALEALRFAKDLAENIIVYTDSGYLVNGITKWVFGWQKNNWISSTKEPVVNRDIWESLVEVTQDIKKNRTITWHQISGHSGVVGNERVDEIATAYADESVSEKIGETIISLYDGEINNYPVDIFDLSENESKKSSKDSKRDRQKGKAYSYVSCVDGECAVDKNWTDCEKRVKGKRGVKFQKVFSADEEKRLIAEWKR